MENRNRKPLARIASDHARRVVLLVGRHGCAKTHVACKLAEALGKNFVAYDASKTLFDDVLGYPDIEKMKQGKIEYLPSKVTVWDKEMILVDELNRAIPEMQAKYLELIRSRKIMGFPTRVRWVLSAMNPVVVLFQAHAEYFVSLCLGGYNPLGRWI